MQRAVYLSEPYCSVIDSRICEIKNIKKKTAIAIEDNIFYPGGGGQPADTGFIKVANENHEVLEIIKMNKMVYLLSDISGDIAGELVRQTIDQPKRLNYMKYHSAAHVLMGAVKRNLKNYSPEGIEISPDGRNCQISFTGSWNGKLDEIEKIFSEANSFIRTSANIENCEYDRLYDAILAENEIYRGPSELKGPVRIIKIHDWDANPCGGTHVKNTNEIGTLSYQSHTNESITFVITE